MAPIIGTIYLDILGNIGRYLPAVLTEPERLWRKNILIDSKLILKLIWREDLVISQGVNSVYETRTPLSYEGKRKKETAPSSVGERQFLDPGWVEVVPRHMSWLFNLAYGLGRGFTVSRTWTSTSSAAGGKDTDARPYPGALTFSFFPQLRILVFRAIHSFGVLSFFPCAVPPHIPHAEITHFSMEIIRLPLLFGVR